MNKKRHSLLQDAILSWVGDDPHREADLIIKVPVKASTLARIKSGSYKPGPILENAIMAVIERTEK